jgi:hypothetical protein
MFTENKFNGKIANNMKTLAMYAMVASSIGWLTTSSYGQDDVTPPLWRGQAGSAFEKWSFATPNNPASPAAVNNPFGLPSLSITVDPTGSGWYDTDSSYGSKQGWWDIGAGLGHMTLHLPTGVAAGGPSSYTEFEIQITYWQGISGAPSLSFSSPATEIGSPTTALVSFVDSFGSWYSQSSIWRVAPSVSDEFVTISGNSVAGSQIEGVIADTLSVPEPSVISLTAVGFGGMALWLRRKRKA